MRQASDGTRAGTPPWHIGVDIGGTFTDVVVVDRNGSVFTAKSASSPDDPAAGVVAALALIAPDLGRDVPALLAHTASFVHGSTVATNILLERTGARVGLLVTEGFRDSLEIRRGIRKQPWDHRTPYPPVLVPRYLRLPVRERIDRLGRVAIPVDLSSIGCALDEFAAEGVESIAVCLLNSYLNPVHERAVADFVRHRLPDMPLSVSSEIAPIAGEYERVSTTVVDAYVAPRLVTYLRTLKRKLGALGLRVPLLLVKNNGGTATVDEIARQPVVLTLSGPAAAVGALHYYGAAIGGDNLISVEVGGTSCDVVMMSGGKVAIVDRLSISDYDMLIPSVEIHTVGAGGGTIAGVDQAGMLFAGPRGAGARPGPACYGLGGTEPTVTDAQVVLGRLKSGRYAGGRLTLDPNLAARSIHDRVADRLGLSLEAAAAGILRVVEQHMLHAVAAISVQRGLDPRRFTLVACGGAGGLHGANVGRLLSCKEVYVPRLAGVFCALGMLHADLRHDFVRAHVAPLEAEGGAEIGHVFGALRSEALAVLDREGVGVGEALFEYEADLRYLGQQWDVRVPLPADGAWHPASIRAEFDRAYDRLFGHHQPEAPVEIVKLRLTGYGRLARPRLVETQAGRGPAGRGPVAEQRPVYVDETVGTQPIPIYQGPDMHPGLVLEGPLVVEEDTTTIFIGRNDRLSVDGVGYRIALSGAHAAP